MHFKDYGVIIKKAGESIKKVNNPGINIELLASHDGTEVIRQHLDKHAWWGIGPSEDWSALEFIYVLDGQLQINIGENKINIYPGDYLKSIPIQDILMVQAVEPTTFLYIASQPVFHNYSGTFDKFRKIAIDVEEKDGYTIDHCSRIMRISMILGKKLRLSSQELYQLNLASFFHDVGKVKVPDHILQKPGKLTNDEWLEIKKHPIYGKEILRETKIPLLVEASIIVEQHHERYDGSGYPYGLKGDEILKGAAIIAVVDSYDAMTTDRVYRKAFTKEKAIEEIVQGSGKMYNPEVVKAFLEIINNINNEGREIS